MLKLNFSNSFVWGFLVVLVVSCFASDSQPVIRTGGLEISLDEKTGLPVRIDSECGRGRAWLQAPVTLEVTNVVTSRTAAPAKFQRRQDTFTGVLEPLALTLHHQWTAAAKSAMKWHLTFDGDAERAEHRIVIDLPVLYPCCRIFTPSQRGVMDVAVYPSFKPSAYARYDWTGAHGYVLPLVSILDPLTDDALTVALPADENIPHLQFEWRDGCAVRLTLARCGMGGGRPTDVELLFFAHAADYRAALKAYSGLFPRYFNPVLPRGPYEGAFYYHHIQDRPKYEEMARQQVRFLWSSFWFTHLGEYLPEEKTWHPYTYAKWWKLGETMSDQRINAFIEEIRGHKIGTYAYFNVTEYGGYGGKEGNAEEAGRRLREKFADALMKTSEGKAIPTWEGAVAMNPGKDYSLRPFLREQIRRHIDRLPHFDGFVVDRLDWASKIDYGHSDGVTMIGGRAVENMAVPVGDAVVEVCRMSHAAGKRVFANQCWRLEVLRDVDGICHEADPLPLLGYLAPLRPVSAWHQRVSYDGDLLRFEAQLKRRLHWALFPQMIAHQFPIAQQKPNARAADLLEIYAPLFEPFLGKRQVLQAHCVMVDGADRANLFINGAGHFVVPVTSRLQFLSRGPVGAAPATVTLKTEASQNLRWAHVYSADGPPYRAKVRTRRSRAVIKLERHATSSVVVTGAGAEPALRTRNASRIAETRARLFPPLEVRKQSRPVGEEERFLPEGIDHCVLTIAGEHVGVNDPMRVFIEEVNAGTLRGNKGRFVLERKIVPPCVDLYAGSESVWFVPRELDLLAVCANEKVYRVARWLPADPCAFSADVTQCLQFTMSPCRVEEWTLPTCRYLTRDVGSGGRWKKRFGTLAAWIPQVNEAALQNGYKLKVTGKSYTWSEDAQHDLRVLEPVREDVRKRPATCRFAEKSLHLKITPPGGAPYRLTLYVLDYDRHGRALDVLFGLNKTQSVSPGQTAEGVYLSYLVQGPAELELANRQGQNVVLSGVFIKAQK